MVIISNEQRFMRPNIAHFVYFSLITNRTAQIIILINISCFVFVITLHIIINQNVTQILHKLNYYSIIFPNPNHYPQKAYVRIDISANKIYQKSYKNHTKINYYIIFLNGNIWSQWLMVPIQLFSQQNIPKHKQKYITEK